MLILFYLLIITKQLITIVMFGNTCTNTPIKIYVIIITRFLFSMRARRFAF